jgi:hypothetical protein
MLTNVIHRLIESLYFTIDNIPIYSSPFLILKLPLVTPGRPHLFKIQLPSEQDSKKIL